MEINVLMKTSACKVAPLLLHDDIDGLGEQKCPEELFRAKKGFEQCQLNFLTTMVDKWDGQTSTCGLFYEPSCSLKATRTDISVKNSPELDRDCRAVIGLKGNSKPRKFRQRKILHKLIGRWINNFQLTSGQRTKE